MIPLRHRCPRTSALPDAGNSRRKPGFYTNASAVRAAPAGGTSSSQPSAGLIQGDCHAL